MIDVGGFGISHLSIPREAQDAAAHATWYEYNNPGGLTPSGTTSGLIKSETVGPISIEYGGTGEGVAGLRPTLFAVVDFIRPLLARNTSSLTARGNRG